MIRTKEKKRNGLFWLIQNIDIKRERAREREREREREGGRGVERDLAIEP